MTASPQRQFETRLPVGFTDSAGQVHRHAIIRKMRGHEEALLYDPTLSASGLVTELILGCLVRLGEMAAVDTGIVSALYTADRNYLLLEIRRVTLGDRLMASYLCPSFGGDVPVMADLGQVEVRRLNDGDVLSDISLTLEDGYEDRDGTLHTEMILTLPRGVDEDFVAPMADRDPLKAQDALTLRCIKRFGTLPKPALEAYGVKILRDLTLGDRLAIDRAFNGEVPGVDLSQRVSCTACGHTFLTALDMTHFFLLSPEGVTGSAGRFSTLPTTSIGLGIQS